MNSTTAQTPSLAWDSIPHYPLGAVPDGLPNEQPLLYRQIAAKRALIAGYEEPEQTAQTIADALADLRHLCDALRLDFAQLDRAAYNSYLAERDSAARSKASECQP